jgi:hypothetical protein
MSDHPIDSSTLESIKEILKIDNKLKSLRSIQKKLEETKSIYRERILETYKENTKFKTPYGNLILKNWQTNYKFSLQEIRDVIKGIDFISDDLYEKIITIFERKSESQSKTVRTLTVRRPKTEKRKDRTHREKNKTFKYKKE